MVLLLFMDLFLFKIKNSKGKSVPFLTINSKKIFDTTSF